MPVKKSVTFFFNQNIAFFTFFCIFVGNLEITFENLGLCRITGTAQIKEFRFTFGGYLAGNIRSNLLSEKSP